MSTITEFITNTKRCIKDFILRFWVGLHIFPSDVTLRMCVCAQRAHKLHRKILSTFLAGDRICFWEAFKVTVRTHHSVTHVHEFTFSVIKPRISDAYERVIIWRSGRGQRRGTTQRGNATTGDIMRERVNELQIRKGWKKESVWGSKIRKKCPPHRDTKPAHALKQNLMP
jgi:hypothetical protein